MDSDMINAEVSAAQCEGREISDACARMIASQYQEGAPSASFATTGAISDATEVWRDCFYLNNGRSLYETLTPSDKRAADCLGTYLIAATRDSETSSRGPVEGWSQLWINSPDREAQ